jgi:hypothetical protein
MATPEKEKLVTYSGKHNASGKKTQPKRQTRNFGSRQKLSEEKRIAQPTIKIISP